MEAATNNDLLSRWILQTKKNSLQGALGAEDGRAQCTEDYMEERRGRGVIVGFRDTVLTTWKKGAGHTVEALSQRAGLTHWKIRSLVALLRESPNLKLQ